MRARIIRVDGSTEQAELPEESQAGSQLKALHSLLNCRRIERLALVLPAPGKPGINVWFDEDALYNERLNATAVSLVMALTGMPVDRYIAGDVVITGGLDAVGDILPLTEIQDSVLAEFIPAVAAGARMAVV